MSKFARVLAVVCFTPAQLCAPLIVEDINRATEVVRVQAYNLTSPSICAALEHAHDRGVNVLVVVDKSQTQTRSCARALSEAGVAVLIDHKPAIAHNKIIVIDDKTVIGGSYNYTENAERRNAENVTWITDPKIVSAFIENWTSRASQSMPFDEYVATHKKK